MLATIWLGDAYINNVSALEYAALEPAHVSVTITLPVCAIRHSQSMMLTMFFRLVV